MNKLPLVSILIPCYNHEKYINETLNSILSDNYINKEIIIINDGSTDSSDAVINEWIQLNSDKIPVKYLKRNNRGITATLNQLVSMANGKYLLPIASDDVLYGDTLTERVTLLEKYEAKNKLVLVSDALVINSESKVILQSSMSNYNNGNKLKYNTEQGIMEEVIMNPSISGATVLINKKIFEAIGNYPEDLNAEDWYFYQRAAAEKAILFFDRAVSLYRVHSANTSGETIPLVRRKKLILTIVKTFYRNILRFKPLKYKVLCIFQFFKFNAIYIKLNIKIFLKTN